MEKYCNNCKCVCHCDNQECLNCVNEICTNCDCEETNEY